MAIAGVDDSQAEEILIQTADKIGIDLRRESHFSWLVDLAANSRLPGDWKEFLDEKGEIAFYHPKLKLIQKEHPVLKRYQHLYQTHKAFLKATNRAAGLLGEEKMVQQVAVILNEVFNRAHKDLPPTTPEIIEALCILLCIESTREFRLVNLLKQTVDIFVEKQYAIVTELEVAADPAELIRLVREEQVKAYVTEKEAEVVMCQECEKKSAKIKCEQCRDFFCKTCFAETHATGKRKTHSTMWLEQLVCQICDKTLASSEICAGTPDAKLFCDTCYFSSVQENPELKKFPKRILSGLHCFECACRQANFICENCVDLFCTECCIKLHRKGRRAKHIQLVIDDIGEVWRGGVQVPPEDAQNLIDRCREKIAAEGHWVAFRDDQLNTYWFNFDNKTTTNQCPYNINN